MKLGLNIAIITLLLISTCSWACAPSPDCGRNTLDVSVTTQASDFGWGIPVEDDQGCCILAGSCCRSRRTYTYRKKCSKQSCSSARSSNSRSAFKKTRIRTWRTRPSRATIKPSDLFNKKDPYKSERGYNLSYEIDEKGTIIIK